MSAEITELKADRLNEIKPLWEKLNSLHYRDSNFFKDHYSRFTFEERIEKFEELADENLFIQIIREGEKPSGYCISTATGKSGELDSLYLDENFRGGGLGRKLVEQAVGWMKNRGCTQIRVSVADGHESVLDFYRKLGFCPRLSVLELKEKK